MRIKRYKLCEVNIAETEQNLDGRAEELSDGASL
jgi:hypothetical protein